jgi:quercetin dioxygenase-like cupin family protein
VSTNPFVVDAASVTGWPAANGALVERTLLGAHTDSPWLEQAVLELASGASCIRTTDAAEELLFVLSGHGGLRVGDEAHALGPETGAYIPPGQQYELGAPDDEELLLVSVRIPDPVADQGSRAAVRTLADQANEPATAERWFTIVFDPDSGLNSATQFIGYIPPVRAEDHFHTYDEVIYVLDGEGAFHAGGQSWPLGPGSSIALPAQTIHRLQNTGSDVLRVLAVFRPAGSPADAYYPTGG